MSQENPRESSGRPEKLAANPAESQPWPASADQPTAQARPPLSDQPENVAPPVAHVKPNQLPRSSSEGRTRASTYPDTGMWRPHEGWEDFRPSALSRLRQHLHRTLHAAILVTQAVDAGKNTPVLSPEAEVQMIVLQARLSGFVFLLREFLRHQPSEADRDGWDYARPVNSNDITSLPIVATDPSEPEEDNWVTFTRADSRDEAPVSRSAKRRTRRVRKTKAKSAAAVSDSTEAAQRES